MTLMNIVHIADRVEQLLKSRALDGYEIMTGNSRTLSIEVKDAKVEVRTQETKTVEAPAPK